MPLLEGAHGCAKGANPFVERYLGDCLYGQVQRQQLLLYLQDLADALLACCNGLIHGVLPSSDLSSVMQCARLAWFQHWDGLHHVLDGGSGTSICKEHQTAEGRRSQRLVSGRVAAGEKRA